MASPKALVGKWLGSLFFRQATVAAVSEPAPRFRGFTLSGESLRGVTFRPGDKVQFFLGDDGMRTYTPVRWDSARGTAEFLAYLHGATPGARWARGLREGDGCQLFGPRSSLPLDDYTGPVLLVGDETSLAVAQSLALVRGGDPGLAFAFEASDASEVSALLPSLGLGGATVVERRPGAAHLGELADAIGARLGSQPGTRLVMTGQAQSIQALRTRLGERGQKASGKNKAYWSVGRVGLD